MRTPVRPAIFALAAIASFASGVAHAENCFPVEGKPLCLSSMGKVNGRFHYLGTRNGKSVTYVRRNGVLTAKAGKPDELPLTISVSQPHPVLWKLDSVSEIRVGDALCSKTSGTETTAENPVAPSNLDQIIATTEQVTPRIPDGLKLPEGIGHLARLASAPGKPLPLFALAHKVGAGTRSSNQHVLLRSDDGVTWTVVSELPAIGQNGLEASLAVASSGHVFFARQDGLTRFDPASGKFELLHDFAGAALADVKISADGTRLAVAGDIGVATLDLAADGSVANKRVMSGLPRLAPQGDDWHTVEFDPKGNLIAGTGLGVVPKYDDACILGLQPNQSESRCVTNKKDLRSMGIATCDAATGQCREASSGLYHDSRVYNFSIEGDRVYASTCNKAYWTSLTSLQSGKPQWQRSQAKVPGNGASSTSPYMRNLFVQARPGNPNHVVAGAQHGFYLSKDGGKTWKLVRDEASAGGVRMAQWLADGSVVISSWEKGASRVAASELGVK